MIRAEQNIEDEESGGLAACPRQLLAGDNPLTVNFLTTDADGKACKGFSSAMRAATHSETENLLDQQHVNRSRCRALTIAKLTGDMFPAKTIA